MKVSDLTKKAIELKLELGDTINLLYESGNSSKAVFRENYFRDTGHPRLQFSKFDFVNLNGICEFYFGSGENKDLDFDLPYTQIERWIPISIEDINKVKQIREDLKNKTSKYIK